MRARLVLGLAVAAAWGGDGVLRDVGEQVQSGERVLGGRGAELGEQLEHWGRLAAATYQRFEDWSQCSACQHEDICNTELAAVWSTAVPAFSRGFVGIDHRRRQVAVVFRGTTHVIDAVTDAQAIQVPWPRDGAMVHAGFLLAYQAARPTIIAALDAAQHNASLAGYSLHFIGHSLGAAQATLAYMDFHQQQQQARPQKGFPVRWQLATLGAPRVGNTEFARLLTQTVEPPDTDSVADENVLRVVHESDMVPHFPRGLLLLHYAHGGREIWARDTNDTAASALTVCRLADDGRDDPACSASISPLQWSLVDHLVYPGMRLGIPKY
ncbi:hypothetical protein H4R19_000671 [Coemansia spiralis]|nr:hypothetical protein H4R19_000671 [Coemansia spiralis]